MIKKNLMNFFFFERRENSLKIFNNYLPKLEIITVNFWKSIIQLLCKRILLIKLLILPVMFFQVKMEVRATFFCPITVQA